MKALKIKLFWKVLLYFWLVFTAIFFFTLFFTYINSDSIRYRNLPPHMMKKLENTSRKMRFILREHAQLNKNPPQFLNNVYLLNESHLDHFGKEIPSMLLNLDKRVLKERRPGIAFKKQTLYFGGKRLKTPLQTYRIYIKQPFSFLSRGYFGEFIREFAINLFVSTFLLSFPLSFWLAWLFTRPIKKLQTAIQDLSNDLNDKNKLIQISKRRDEFGDLAKDFDLMATHLNEIISSKTRLLSDVSHELKSPLARLQIALGIANRKQPFESSELERIKLEADRMNQMITGLLDYAKIDNQYAKPEEQTFNLSELLEILVKDAAFEGHQNQINIKTELQQDINITAIKSLLISCIENILRNAIRYAEKEINISCYCQNATNNSQKKSVIITISDDGQGVEEKQLQKIFDAFYRPEMDRSRQSGGVGLGLSIALKAILLHDGKISAQNIKPHGLKITISLPI